MNYTNLEVVMFSITKNIKKGGSLFVEKITSTLIFLFLILSYTYAGNEWVSNLIVAEKNVRANPNCYKCWFDYAMVLHEVSSEGYTNLSKKAVEAWEKVLKFKNDPAAKAFLGSSWTVVARDSVNPIEKLIAVDKGSRIMDDALNEDPTNIIVRRVRFETYLQLPDMFNKLKFAEEDIDYLFKVYKSTPQVFEGVYDPGYIFLGKAKVLLKKGEGTKAKAIAEAGLKIAKDEKCITKIKEFLEKFR
jgi:tetratricopeptide (TPR) repeat protein